MFEILPNPSLETVMIVARGAVLVGAFWVFALAFVRWRRADERHMIRLHEQLERAFAEVRSLHETVTVMSARIESLSERAESEARRVPASTGGTHRGYDLAARLAKNGAGVEELVSSCGVTRHEAELLTRLHAAKARETAESSAWQSRAPAPQAPPSWPAKSSPQAETPTSPPAPQSGRKRGSLLSVVG